MEVEVEVEVEVVEVVGARHAVEAYLGGGERPAQRARKQQVDPGLARGLARPQLRVELPRLRFACRREARVPRQRSRGMPRYRSCATSMARAWQMTWARRWSGAPRLSA